MPKHNVGTIDEIPQGQSKAVKVSGNKILVFHLDSGFYATEANCPHLKMPLAKGQILDDDTLQCPIHRAKFCIKSGDVKEWACFPPGIQLLNVIRGEKTLKTYPVSVDNNDLFVDL